MPGRPPKITWPTFPLIGGVAFCGALVSVYQQEERGSDAAAWLGGERDEAGKRQAGIAGVTVAALREVGLLDEIIPTKEGLVLYPTELEE